MDNEEILSVVNDLNDRLDGLADRLAVIENKADGLSARMDQLVASHNAVGENVQWLVANTQGVFQMLNSPDMIGQMMGMLGGGLSGGLPNLKPDAGT